MVYWILFWWKLYQIIFIQIWDNISVSIFFDRWDVDAIIDNFFSLTLIDDLFSVNPCILFTHGIIEWMNGFKVSASVLEPRSLSCERLFNTCSWHLLIDLLVSTSTASFSSLGSIFLCKQIFEIHIFILSQSVTSISWWKIAVILCGLVWLLWGQAILNEQLWFILALTPDLVWSSLRHHLHLTVYLLLVSILKLH